VKQHYKTFIFFVLGLSISLCSISFIHTDTQQEHLLQIAGEYKTYHRHDHAIKDTASLKWTIQLCAPAAPIQHETMDSFSFSKPSSVMSKHGNKLYVLYVKNMRSYEDTTKKIQPIGQVLVKETWNVREVPKDHVGKSGLAMKQSKNDGKWYTPVSVSELFIMYKEPKNKDNDEGWVYGIVNLEGKKSSATILENGKISTCISCHKETKYDRIFGVK
jgi:hypothetical protein